ncbi:ATP-binding protein [Roseateles aquatilis]|uniref:ATP-binding protein n=1 Tax=Roseateles aquatilis TaxID=431061 RepID=A0A246J8V5_9BURK|nr:AAA family ATPase [Roseateles aquatilis]OWQ88970.1 ATP-binding protein [Roseateles aquatilis]
MLRTLAVANYRSLRQLRLPLDRLTLITGPNGSGKSSLYRALRLLADAAQNRVLPALALEGGLDSTLWAGPEEITRAMRAGEVPVTSTVRKEPINLKLGIAGDDFGYSLELGLPQMGGSMFARDPQIKREALWAGPVYRPASALVERRNGALQVRDGREWALVDAPLASFDSMLAQYADPALAPEMITMRERLRGWRFYDSLRTDLEAPARRARVGTFTPVLAGDGADLAAAWQTIVEIGDGDTLDRCLQDAFPGAAVTIGRDAGGFRLSMRQPGLLRALDAAELSDGTLRYLMLLAALLSPRPPELLALNEPENSLHPDLLPALGRLIATASRHSQLIVVSHARRLISTLEEQDECRGWQLEKDLGETRLRDLMLEDTPPWHWPSR